MAHQFGPDLDILDGPFITMIIHGSPTLLKAASP